MAGPLRLLAAYAALGTDTLKRDRTIIRFKDRLDGPAAFFDLDELTATSSMEEEDSARLIASLNQLPMGRGQRLVIVRDAQELPASIRGDLVAYLANPNPDASLLLVADKLDARSKLYKAIAALGKAAIIRCDAPKGKDVGSQVQRMASELGLHMEPLAQAELIDRVGANPALLSRALRTLREQDPELSHVTEGLIRSSVARTESVAPWVVADAVISRNGRKALEFIAESDDGSLIGYHIWITRYLREALVAKELEAEGWGEQRGEEMLAERFGERPQEKTPANAWRHRAPWRASRRFSRAELVSALAGALDVENALKGSANEKSELVRWICSICA